MSRLDASEPSAPEQPAFSLHVASPRTAYGVLAVVASASLALVLVLGRAPAPTRAAAIGLGVEAALFALLAAMHRDRASTSRRVLQAVALVVAGLATGAVGWFFGPNAGVAAYFALACLLAGLLTGASPVPRPALGGWLTYLALALGQAAVFALVLAGYLADESLTIVIIGPHPDWHHAMAHASLQGVYLAAFLWGRAFQRRYRELSRELIEVLRATARRATLVEEARHEYRRALAAGRHGVLSAAPPSSVRLEAPSPEATDVGPPSSSVVAERSDDLSAMLRGTGRLSRDELERLATDLSSALEERHARGSVHLEVEPRVVVVKEGAFELIDPDPGLAPPGEGPPHALRYLAPERLVGAVVDARADVYGMAATLYAAVTAHEPYADVADSELARAVAERLPLDPSLVSAIPGDVALVLRIALAREPLERFATPSELRGAFVDALDERLAESWRSRARTMPPFASRSPEEEEPPPSRSLSRDSFVEPSIEPPDTFTEAPWREAYRAKMRAFYIGITGLCVVGTVVLAAIAREPRPRMVAWTCMAAIVAIAWAHSFIERQRPERPTYWLWALVGLFSVGPAYSFGLHSGFAAVVATWLFAGGVFRAGRGESQLDRRGWVLAGVLFAHTTAFVLIMAGVVPDHGNVVVRQVGAPPWETIVLHVLMMAAYVAAYAGGVLVDRRFDAQTRLAETAARRLERQDAKLASAQAQLGRLLEDEARGIFSDVRVGHFLLGRVLGRGSMGEVYDAVDTDSNERVALKVVRPDRVADPLHLGLFLSEAESLRRVHSSRVARVLEVAGIDQEMPYIAMEYVEGRSLSEILRERERLDLTTALEMLRHLARGLQDVHACGIIHCDLKPLNVIETRSDLWKIVDFGVATPREPSAVARRFGTPAYMSPEQARGQGVDARSDLYSLSVLLYRALTGRPPFTGTKPEDFADSADLGGPPDPRAYAELPDDVALVLAIGLAVRPEDRFQSAI